MLKPRKGLCSFFDDSTGAMKFKLYDTIILELSAYCIRLNSGGYLTRHTKNCINDNLPEGYSVFQKDFEWFVKTPLTTIDFADNMIIERVEK